LCDLRSHCNRSSTHRAGAAGRTGGTSTLHQATTKSTRSNKQAPRCHLHLAHTHTHTRTPTLHNNLSSALPRSSDRVLHCDRHWQVGVVIRQSRSCAQANSKPCSQCWARYCHPQFRGDMIAKQQQPNPIRIHNAHLQRTQLLLPQLARGRSHGVSLAHSETTMPVQPTTPPPLAWNPNRGRRRHHPHPMPIR
jgi:hypothetical protein